MYFSLRFVLWLRWKDNRLTFENLDETYYHNKLSENEASKLWTPVIQLKNNQEGKVLKFDSSSEMFLRRNQTSIKVAPLDQAFDAKVYESNETEIIWMSTHLLKFKCQFDLYYLPFDNQTCYVEVSHYLITISLLLIWQ